MTKQEQQAWLQRHDLPAEFAPDRPTGTGDENDLILDVRRDLREVHAHRISGEQIFGLNGADAGRLCSIVEQLEGARQDLHGGRPIGLLDARASRYDAFHQVTRSAWDRDNDRPYPMLANQGGQVVNRSEHGFTTGCCVEYLVVDAAHDRVRKVYVVLDESNE
ncbi:MAG TPA: hypothetical protein VEJ41_05425 [Candidatus Acidoferrales bacterium]|nr:hypothetical protein [Candidatus Acidoferrales bacterium]